ncbi:hypothetical protein evm_011345 [Chilo suppressalis]|nr:hypothetical protein evm_011345 [Chilo suppressalis]
MGDQKLLSRAPPCFGRHVKPSVPAASAVVSTHQSALGPRGGCKQQQQHQQQQQQLQQQQQQRTEPPSDDAMDLDTEDIHEPSTNSPSLPDQLQALLSKPPPTFNASEPPPGFNASEPPPFNASQPPPDDINNKHEEDRKDRDRDRRDRDRDRDRDRRDGRDRERRDGRDRDNRDRRDGRDARDRGDRADRGDRGRGDRGDRDSLLPTLKHPTDDNNIVLKEMFHICMGLGLGLVHNIQIKEIKNIVNSDH